MRKTGNATITPQVAMTEGRCMLVRNWERYCASAMMTAIFASSEGWMPMKPSLIHRLDPLTVSEASTTTSRIITTTNTGMVMAWRKRMGNTDVMYITPMPATNHMDCSMYRDVPRPVSSRVAL